MNRRAVSSLVASLALIVVGVIVGIAVAYYAMSFGIMTISKAGETLRIIEARYYYFVSKPLPYVQCSTPPCGVLIIKVYSSEQAPLDHVSFGGTVWRVSDCTWSTSQHGLLDVGYNILVFQSPSAEPPCRVISKKANQRLYAIWDAILESGGMLSRLNYVQQYALKLYSTLSISEPSRQWLYIASGGKVYRYLVIGTMVTG